MCVCVLWCTVRHMQLWRPQGRYGCRFGVHARETRIQSHAHAASRADLHLEALFRRLGGWHQLAAAHSQVEQVVHKALRLQQWSGKI